MIVFVFVSVVARAEAPYRVYSVSGSDDAFLWKGSPFRPRTILEFTKFILLHTHHNVTGLGDRAFEKEDIFDATARLWGAHWSVGRQLRRLRRKGYQVVHVPRIEAEHLFRLLAAPETLAVFHGGHSYAPDGLDRSLLVRERRGEMFLGVFQDGRESALVDSVEAETLRRVGTDYRAADTLALFYSEACYAGFCEAAWRKRLRLAPATQFLSPKDQYRDRPSDLTIFADVVRSFRTDVAAWVDALPSRSCGALTASR